MKRADNSFPVHIQRKELNLSFTHLLPHISILFCVIVGTREYLITRTPVHAVCVVLCKADGWYLLTHKIIDLQK